MLGEIKRKVAGFTTKKLTRLDKNLLNGILNRREPKIKQRKTIF